MNAFQAGLYNLGDRAITAALTDQVITEASLNGQAVSYLRLDGMKSVTLFADFVYGSSGTTAAVIVQTSLDGGQSWVDVCRFDFTTANAKKHATVGIFGNVGPAAVAAIGTEGKLDGILGDRLRAKLTTTGTYAGNTSVAVRAVVR